MNENPNQNEVEVDNNGEKMEPVRTTSEMKSGGSVRNTKKGPCPEAEQWLFCG